MNSWGLYIVSSVALVLVIAPQLGSLTRDSREGIDWRNVDGIRSVVNSLGPGVLVNLSFGRTSAEDPVVLRGLSFSCAYGNGTIVLPSRWPLPNMTLLPGHHYRLWLSGEEVQVIEAG
jgi:hypothetical protein